MYQDRLLAEYRAPQNRREMAEPTGDAAHRNPLCGDAIRIMVRDEGGLLTDVAFLGQGCSLAVASASLLTQAVRARSRAEARALSAAVAGMLTRRAGDAGTLALALPLALPEALPEALSEALDALRGVAPFPARHDCVLMPWRALEDALGNSSAPSAE